MGDKGVAERPVTCSEMNTILQPMLHCLGRMETMLQQLNKEGVPQSALLGDQVVNNSALSNAQSGDTVKNIEGVSSAHEPTSLGGAHSSNQATSKVKDEDCIKKEHSVSGFGHVDTKEELNTLKALDDDDLQGALDLLEKHNILKAFEKFEKGVEANVTFLDNLVKMVKHSCAWWNAIEEPQRTSVLSRMTNSGPFESSVRLAITANSVIVAVAADWQIKHIGQGEPQVFALLEAIFSIFFLIELVLRLSVHRCYFFVNAEKYWNIMDFVLVAISVVDFALGVFLGSSSNNNVAFMRLLRFLKLTRILRSLRSFRFFRQLTVLLESFVNSFVSLFWGFVMLFFVLYLFALIFLQALVEYLDTDDVAPDRVLAVESSFGTLSEALLSLYMSVTGGRDWDDCYEIIAYTGSVYALIFVLFTFFFLFALFNILTGSLVEKAMSSSKPDRTDLILTQRKAMKQQQHDFLEICKQMDENKNGTISWKEFLHWLDNPVMIAYMETMGIDIHDAHLFFATVGAHAHRGKTVNTGEISIEHFVEGCFHMKGSASAIDMQRQLYEMHILHHDLLHVESALLDEFQKLKRLMSLGLEPGMKKWQPAQIARGTACDVQGPVDDVQRSRQSGNAQIARGTVDKHVQCLKTAI